MKSNGVCLGVLLALLTPELVFACSCEESPPSVRFDEAVTVLCGRVVHKKQVNVPFERDGKVLGYVDNYVYSIVVHALWKGQPTDTMQVRTDQGSACGTKLPMDTDILVYTYLREGAEWTSSCQGDGPIATAFLDRYYLGEPIWHEGEYALAPVSVYVIFDAMASADEGTRASAAYALARIVEDRDLIVPRLLEMLRSDDASKQVSSLWAFRDMRQSAAEFVPAIEGALGSPASIVRKEGHFALQWILGNCKYFSNGVAGLNDESDEVRSAAARGLQNTGACTTDQQQRALLSAVETAMNVSTDTTRGYLVYLLKECGCIASDWIPILETWEQGDSSDWVRYCARVTAPELRAKCP